jgi:hypothetical protein
MRRIRKDRPRLECRADQQGEEERIDDQTIKEDANKAGDRARPAEKHSPMIADRDNPACPT